MSFPGVELKHIGGHDSLELMSANAEAFIFGLREFNPNMSTFF